MKYFMSLLTIIMCFPLTGMNDSIPTTQCKHCNAIIELAPIAAIDASRRGIKRNRKGERRSPSAKIQVSSIEPNSPTNVYFPLTNTWFSDNKTYIVKNTFDIPSTTPSQTK
jgi:hypothetical protein